jgi:hypothetical protein
MARKVFYSFHFKEDAQRVSQIKQIGAIEGQPLLSSNQWEEVKKGGDKAIEEWIAAEIKGKSCLVVLIGTSTAGRRWVDHEITKAWNGGKGVLGVHIHNLKNLAGQQSRKGSNPFTGHTIEGSGASLSTIVKAYDPPSVDSKAVYDHIKDKLESWVEEAIEIRKNFGV